MTHASVLALCRSIKLQCELYPSRNVVLCLDPYSGLAAVLWTLVGYVHCFIIHNTSSFIPVALNGYVTLLQIGL